MGRIINISRGSAVLVAHAVRADDFWRRAIGLLGHARLPSDAGLWLVPCSAVHTCGMRFALDLLFLDHDGRVVRLSRNVPPWRFFVGGGARAVSVIELAAGWLPRDAVALGDQLVWANA
ncbi:MAG: DUF192 domain-containing protein [Verrucomicrobia bacterium]|nr:MAG: DUF192 domain-containing protein [Verrucomicrobiota bacterium]